MCKIKFNHSFNDCFFIINIMQAANNIHAYMVSSVNTSPCSNYSVISTSDALRKNTDNLKYCAV